MVADGRQPPIENPMRIARMRTRWIFNATWNSAIQLCIGARLQGPVLSAAEVCRTRFEKNQRASDHEGRPVVVGRRALKDVQPDHKVFFRIGANGLEKIPHLHHRLIAVVVQGRIVQQLAHRSLACIRALQDRL